MTSYSWTPSSGLNHTNTATVIASPTVTTTYTVTGSTSHCSPVTHTVLVTVNPTPTLTVNNATICSGGSATLSVTGNGTSYTWNPSTDLNATTGTLVVASPTVTNTYIVTATIGTCTANATSIVTVNPLPSLTVTPTATIICSGTSVPISASGASTYSWVPATGLNHTNTANVVATPTAYTSYTVTGTKTSTGCMSSSVIYVYVNPNPTVTVNSATICAGGSATLTAMGNGSSFTWSPGTGLNVTTGTTVIATPTASTVYTVIDPSVPTCTASATANVTVNSLPVVNITPTATTICSGASLHLIASGASTYIWKPSISLNDSNTANVLASPTVTTTYTVTGTKTSTGCTATAVVTVSVNPTPTVMVNSDTICGGVSATLTATGNGTGYSWSPATGLNTTTGTTVIANPTSTTNYVVTASIGTCTSSATGKVTVNPTPTVTVTSPTVVCFGSSVHLTASGAGNYTWTPSTGLNHFTGANVTDTPTITTTYTVTGSTGKHCMASAVTTVSVNPTPTLTVNAPDTICNSGNVTLTATGNGTNYSWSPATGLNTTIGASVIASPTVTTTYVVTASIGTCTNSVNAKVNVKPQPTISVSPSDTSVCLGGMVMLKASGSGNYTWTPAAGLNHTNTATVKATPSVSTTYTVTANTGFGCTDTAVVTVTVYSTPSLTITGTESICTGNSTILTASGATTYTWSVNAGSVTTNTISVSPSSNTTYTVIGANGTCGTAISVATVTVNPTPTLTLNPVNPPDTLICAGARTTLLAYGTSGATFTWFPATGLSTTTGTAVVAGPPVTTEYTVTATLGTCTATDTCIVIVNPHNLSVNSATVCAGSTATLTAIGTYYYNAQTTFTWVPSTGLSAVNGYSVIASPTVTTIYTVTETSYQGCITIKTSTVTVVAPPPITVNSATICAGGGSATLTASGVYTNYSWSPSTGLNSTTGDTVISNVTTTTIYTVTGSLGSGCSTTATSTVTINPVPTITLNPVNPPDTLLCEGSHTNLLAMGTSGATFTWFPATGLSATTGTSVVANPTVTTEYTVTASLGGCTATDTCIVVVLMPSLSLSVSSATIDIGQSIPINAYGTYYAPVLTTFSWTPSTGLSATTGSAVTASPMVTTVYTVTELSYGGCVTIKTCTVTVISGDGDGNTPSACYCVSSFAPYPGKKYLISAWAREDGASGAKTSFTFPAVYIDFNNSASSLISTAGAFVPSGTIIDGWQRIEGTFIVPDSAYFMNIRLTSTSGDVLYDDIRVFPFQGSMKTYVYDPVLLRLVAEQDERNYSTLFEYDEEGKLIRVKKETERGIKTIKESRNSEPKTN